MTTKPNTTDLIRVHEIASQEARQAALDILTDCAMGGPSPEHDLPLALEHWRVHLYHEDRATEMRDHAQVISMSLDGPLGVIE